MVIHDGCSSVCSVLGVYRIRQASEAVELNLMQESLTEELNMARAELRRSSAKLNEVRAHANKKVG